MLVVGVEGQPKPLQRNINDAAARRNLHRYVVEDFAHSHEKLRYMEMYFHANGKSLTRKREISDADYCITEEPSSTIIVSKKGG